MTFVEDDGTEIKVEAELGSTLLEVAHENDVELEGMIRALRACFGYGVSGLPRPITPWGPDFVMRRCRGRLGVKVRYCLTLFLRSG